MPITDQLTIAVREHVLPGVANQIDTMSPLVVELTKRATEMTGIAGNGIAGNAMFKRNEGRFYSGLDPGEAQHTEKLKKWFTQWTNYQADMVLDGTTLEENLGISTGQIVAANSDIRNFGRLGTDSAGILVNLAGVELQGALSSIRYNGLERGLWGALSSEDNTERAPENFTDLFDETASLHGFGPSELGEFPSHDPWSISPPGQTSKNIWEPRIFDMAGQTISKALINAELLRMSARFPGRRIASLHPTQADILFREFDPNMEVQIPMGASPLDTTVRAYELHGTFIVPDEREGLTSMKVLHVEGMSRRAGAVELKFWRDTSQTNFPVRTVTPEGEVIRIPYYIQEWDRDGKLADAISCAVQVKYGFCCSVRAANAEFRDFAAA